MHRVGLVAHRDPDVGAGLTTASDSVPAGTHPAPTHWNHGPTSSVAMKLTTLAAWTRPAEPTAPGARPRLEQRERPNREQGCAPSLGKRRSVSSATPFDSTRDDVAHAIEPSGGYGQRRAHAPRTFVGSGAECGGDRDFELRNHVAIGVNALTSCRACRLPGALDGPTRDGEARRRSNGTEAADLPARRLSRLKGLHHRRQCRRLPVQTSRLRSALATAQFSSGLAASR